MVREYCGHGIGRGFHEDPQVLHYGMPRHRPRVKPGMTFTIEPMVNAGKRQVKPAARRLDRRDQGPRLSAQWEHTVLVTATGYEVLTLGADDRS